MHDDWLMPASMVKYGIVSLSAGRETARVWKEADVRFYAHAHADIPALVAEVRRLREALAAVHDRVDAAEMDHNIVTGALPLIDAALPAAD